tara:strand:- start:3168 stop:3761 length:594 start_codon:yes stop_codon:yes gene_type:complete
MIAAALAVLVCAAAPARAQIDTHATPTIAVTERTSESHYEVTGLTPQHLARSFQRQPNPGVMAQTDGGLSLRFDFAFGDQGCQLMGAELALHIHTTYPLWRERDRGPEAMRREWDRFAGALRVHEDIHGDLFRSEAQRLAERLESLPPARSCDGLHRAIDRERDAFDRAITQAQAAYERDTRNGAAQGARLRFSATD